MFGRSLFGLNCLLRPSQVTLVDTVGAWPTFQCEVSGQSEAIATNLTVMAGLKVPIVTGKHALLLLAGIRLYMLMIASLRAVLVGEGGSGGALGICMGNSIGVSFLLAAVLYATFSTLISYCWFYDRCSPAATSE